MEGCQCEALGVFSMFIMREVEARLLLVQQLTSSIISFSPKGGNLKLVCLNVFVCMWMHISVRVSVNVLMFACLCL